MNFVGVHSCEVENKGAIFIAQALYRILGVCIRCDLSIRTQISLGSLFYCLTFYFIMVAMFILGTGNSNHRGFMEGMENKDKDKKDSKDMTKIRKIKIRKTMTRKITAKTIARTTTRTTARPQQRP